MTEHDGYSSDEYDLLKEGAELKVEHHIDVDETDMSDLVSKPLEELQALREASVAKEKTAFEKAQLAAVDWEKQAAVTRQYDRALEYLNMPEPDHTSNKWVKDKHDNFTISNRVYRMSYDIYERSNYRYRTDEKKYDVRWSICTNTPFSKNSYKIAGQGHVFATREEAEKYMQGRIKAYAHLFTEISPPIPKQYEQSFMVYGQLLPGYVTEDMQKEQAAQQPKKEQAAKQPEKKPSIRQQLTAKKPLDKAAPAKPKGRSSPEPGLE